MRLQPLNRFGRWGVFQQPAKRLRALMDGDLFDFPKDEVVLQEIVEMLTEGDDIVLDFFAGSSTTAHSQAIVCSVEAQRVFRYFYLDT